MNGFLLLLFASLLTSGGQLCQKKAALYWQNGEAGCRRKNTLAWMAAAIGLMAVALLAWLGALQRLPLSLAYPMLSLNVVLVTLCARWLFRERVTLRHWCGVAFVIAGIALMGLNL
ncbi:4-amino-4-deoxy-L-arabinose-phosphoundecaprenol flippase subunit ArnE [Martelella alba]|uniref:4-amino-4-deoxy-L-arabinose-phosphoundecaprenol flippase subunit ArnE n=1 Tax=Martelella alba TaxID=2590451 RepID=A0ABY2SJ34_9HYPH|nr:4-amino-4-deoxy-L-arabinose-phosphoundecaprenol flippase subunit ArnE [Martelella alba]TKI04660.1 4-amino-4-deoxy-L-arabinose-phosphoundecaprenol flippase subunit ArnE [Martelella alba]